MRYLIDTHIFIWASYGLESLPPKAAAILQEARHQIFISTASLWEIAIKTSLGKLTIDITLFDQLEKYNYILLPISTAHLHATAKLPRHHKDPFDRLLIAQAACEKLTLITSDEQLLAYEETKIILA